MRRKKRENLSWPGPWRELAEFGSRILPGGDMFEAHQAFLRDSAAYDHGAASCSSRQHELWLSQLTCPVLRLDGGEDLEKNAERIIAAYEKAQVQ